MIEGLKVNRKKIKEDLNKSLMLVTALTPSIGYENAAKIAQLAHTKNISLREASKQLGYINSDDFDNLVNPKKMISPTN